MISIHTMRTLDRCFGGMLCRIAAAIEPVRRRFTASTPPPAEPNRILFIELSEAGSTLLAAPAVHSLQQRYPRAQLWWLIFQHQAQGLELLQLLPPEHILTIRVDSARAFLVDTFRSLRTIRRLGIDTVIDLELFSRFTALLTFASGANRRVGFHPGKTPGLYRGNFLTHPVFFNPYRHVSQNFLTLIEAVAEKPAAIPVVKKKPTDPDPACYPRLSQTPELRKRGAQILAAACPEFSPDNHCLILLNPDPGALPLRAWPPQAYAELTRRLLDYAPAARIGILGLPESQPRAQAILDSAAHPHCFSLAGHTKNFRDLVALFHHAALVVANDGGPAHFAAAAGRPTVVLFGPESPQLYRPLGPQVACLYAGLCCSPCYSAWNFRNSPCTDNRCLQAIPVDQVFQACRTFLRQPPRK